MTDSEPFPALFVSHGAPTLPLEDSPARRFLEHLADALPRPRAILAISAHWETDDPALSAAKQPQTIHDFHGFPEALYRLRYPAPGAPDLAARAAKLIEASGARVRIDPERGLDHGAWTPLMLMYPRADVPVTQLSVQPREGPAHHIHIGEALRPLREESVLILGTGTGSATHNLREFRGQPHDTAPAPWAVEFGEWLAATLEARRDEDLLAYRERAPHAVRNHQTDEHLLPLFVAAGAATPGRPATRLHSSYAFGVIGMDAYRFD